MYTVSENRVSRKPASKLRGYSGLTRRFRRVISEFFFTKNPSILLLFSLLLHVY